MLKRTAQFLVVLIALGPAQANECDVTAAEQATATIVTSGDSFGLSDGRRVRLAGIQAPRAGWPLAEKARANLAKHLEGKIVDLAYADRGTDRHGDLLAFVFVGEELVQSRLIDEGSARAYSRADTSRCAVSLLKREAGARAAKRGLWANAFYRIRSADGLDADIGTFQIVESRVVSVKKGRERTFLNFGPDYRTDLTVTISARDMKRLARDGVDPASWSGKNVRVRGWLSLLNGPEIELTHAQQLEVLD